MTGRSLVREARRRAGITQAELAERAGTTQSAIARVESGATSPSMERVVDLVRACGFDLDVRLVPPDAGTWGQAARNRGLSPDRRLRNMLATQRFVAAGRDARTTARRQVRAPR